MNVTVLGELARGRAIGRSGAKPGDGIYVTGVLGEAQLGLDLLLKTKNGQRLNRKLLAHHLYPALPLDFALWLGRNQVPTSMMDFLLGSPQTLPDSAGPAAWERESTASRYLQLPFPYPCRNGHTSRL